jgi:hypothetical protein
MSQTWETPPAPRGVKLLDFFGKKRKVFRHRNLRLKCSPSVDGGLSGGSSVCRPGSEDPIGASGNSFLNLCVSGIVLTKVLSIFF